MKHDFYDVKNQEKVTTDVVECVTYGTTERPRYALRGKTADGRNLTAFVNKAKYEEAQKAISK